jgi:hypothetical protein
MDFEGGLRATGTKATSKFQIDGELGALIHQAQEMSGDLARMIADVEKASKIKHTNPMWMRVRARFMSEAEFLFLHASGTLRKNARLGFDYKKQLLHERTAFDFGYGFEAIHESHVNWGTPITEGDCHAITESGWHTDRYESIAFPGDEFEVKYLKIHTGNGPDREGVGIIIRKTSAPYVPNNYVVFSLIAEVGVVKHDYKDAVNPC